MKNIISIILLFIISSSIVLAQDLSINKMEHVKNDLSGRVNLRLDKNDNPCALVKVYVASQNVEFNGDVIGDVAFSKEHFDVYMKQESTSLNVNIGSRTKDINFSDYGIRSLEGRQTYILMLGADFTETYLNEAKSLSEDFFETKSFEELDGEELYMRGCEYYSKHDYNNAIKFLQKACDKKYAKAYLKLGTMYYEGINDVVDYEKARENLIKAVNNNAGGEVVLSEIYRKGLGVASDQERSFALLLNAAQDNSYEAMLKIAERYRYGIGVTHDRDIALVWYQKVADTHSKYTDQAKEEINTINQETPVTLKSLISYPLGISQCGNLLTHTNGTIKNSLNRIGLNMTSDNVEPYKHNVKQTYHGLPVTYFSFEYGGFSKRRVFYSLKFPKEYFPTIEDCIQIYEDIEQDFKNTLNLNGRIDTRGIRGYEIDTQNIDYNLSLNGSEFITFDKNNWRISISFYERK